MQPNSKKKLSKVPCPRCAHPVRSNAVADHLNELHDEYTHEWGLKVMKMKRKDINHLTISCASLARDINKVNNRIWIALDRLQKMGRPINDHGLALLGPYQDNPDLVIDAALATKAKKVKQLGLATRLVTMRTEIAALGRFQNGSGGASYGQVADELEALEQSANFDRAHVVARDAAAAGAARLAAGDAATADIQETEN